MDRPPTVLLLHGLTGTPTELAPLAAGLREEGWSTISPTWPGHCARAEDLARTDPEQLLDAARGLADARAEAVVGLSMGALLALVTAAASPTVRAVVLLAPAVRMRGLAALFERLGFLPGLPPDLLVPKPLPRRESEVGNAPGIDAAAAAALADESSLLDGRYDAISLAWARGLHRVREVARGCAGRLRQPVLVAHGLDDSSADPRSVLTVVEWLSATSPRVLYVAGAGHQLAAGGARAVVAAEVARFLRPFRHPHSATESA